MSERKRRNNGETQPSSLHNPVMQSARWRQVLRLGEDLLSAKISPVEASRDSAGSSTAGLQSSKYPGPATLLAQRGLIIKTAAEVLGGKASLWLAEGLLPSLAGKPSNGMENDQETFAAEPPTPLMRRALQTRQICCIAQSNPAGIQEGEACQSAAGELRGLAAPLVAQDDETGRPVILGVLQLERPDGPPYDDLDVALLDGLAVQAAIALQADRQMAIERWRIEQLTLVRRVSAQINNVRDLDELARRITSLIQQTFDYYYVAIFTLEPGQDVLHFRASAGPLHPNPRRLLDAPQAPFSPALSVHLGEGIIGRVAETGREIVAGDVSRDEYFLYLDSLPETRSEVTLPLKIEDRVLGVLDVQSDQPDAFQDIDLLVLHALAGNIASAVEGARLYSALRRRAEHLSTISEVSIAITSILDTEQLLNEVVSLIQKRFGYRFVHLFTVHPGRRKVIYEAGTGAVRQALNEQAYTFDLDDPAGIIPWVARHGETVLANDVLNEPRYRPSPLPPDETRAELTVPLIFGGDVLGILDVQSDRAYAFSEDDRYLFEALAGNIAIAMRNASLYRSEKWRRQVTDSLQEVAGLLSADASLDQVLKAILSELERNLPCDLAAIWLLDNEASETETSSGNPPLRLAAAQGAVAAGLDLEIGLTLQEILSLAGQEQDAPAETSWLVTALEADHPIVRSSDDAFDPLRAALDFPPDYSAIATPLRVGDQRLGVLTLAHHTPGRYGTESRAMTAAFASSAAVAIENTRLFEAAHEQAWVSTVLLQVTEATQSLTNLNELLATVVSLTPMLVGVKACFLYILDEDESFVPAAASGLKSEQQAEFERWRFAPGDVPALDELLVKRQPMILYGKAEDPRLSSILTSGFEAEASLFEDELLMLVPLLAHGEVLGALVVDYSNEKTGSSLEALEEIFDERLSIVQGIAHQTAIAAENIRLLKAQKEEAYVSVALLQVAQAVVSTNDLDDILGAIVRITPILVGVKRAAIYLWDPVRQVFVLAQAYGIPRYADQTWYAPDDFPLLESTHQEDRLIAYPLDDQDLDSLEGPEAWVDFLPPDEEEVEVYLQTKARLLLAFPLSVKGSALGVMVVEEPDPLPMEGSISLSANRRLREKRLEIATGISQQAALAIQNDQLQQEMVERERLEREMQLAREIQRTFLPNELPDLPGWDLNALWRTAREVGGDYYDYFPLPGGRFGLVIADVADKGMPAALFMTMVRTLLRATAQEEESPAEVLERVNDALVPDMQQGMFVTLFYAVLTLDNGQLTYANAGHNPPLVARHSSGEVQRSAKGGMALGVQEGSQLSEYQMLLEPGDYLILYTDGVTEAFSEQGEMFGEESLRQAIQTELAQQAVKEQASAWQMLSAIDTTLSTFTGASAPSDDLTLVVVRREI